MDGGAYATSNPRLNAVTEWLKAAGMRFSIRRGLLRLATHLYNANNGIDQVLALPRAAFAIGEVSGRLGGVVQVSAGKTKEGIELGMPRNEVQKKLGKKQGDPGATWTLPGLVVRFDATGVVQRLVVTKG